MKRKAISGWIGNLSAVLLVISAFLVPAEARTQRMLAARTQLRPVGMVPAQLFWFAPGVVWVDDFDGGVQSGTLDQTASLKIWNSNASVSFGPGFIRFERAGGVKEGTLQTDTQLCVVSTASNSKTSLTFQGRKTVEFGYDGCVMKGTLAQEAALKSWNNQSKTYPAGSLVDFNGAGLVTRAILPPSDPSPQDGNYSGTCTIVGIGAFPFAFKAAGGFFSGGRDQTLFSLHWQGNFDKAGNILIGMITGWVDVGTGEQKTRWTVRGPMQGTITPNLSRGNFSAVAADGNRTWTGTWTASTGAPVVQPCANYFGPIEPLRIAGAGPSQNPGTYWLVYAAAPRTPDPPEKWNWKKYGPVTLRSGKRYFVIFGRGAEIKMTEESNLPAEETMVTAVPGTAVVWQENDSGNGDRIAYCFQLSAASGTVSHGSKPVLHVDFSALDGLRTNQTFTLTATAENIPASVTKLKFGWYLHLSDCLSADPPGQKVNLWYNQIVTPVNGKATCSITVKADSSPRETQLQLFVQDEPYKKIVFLSADKDYAIKQ